MERSQCFLALIKNKYVCHDVDRENEGRMKQRKESKTEKLRTNKYRIKVI
jgi:hypothetical protein